MFIIGGGLCTSAVDSGHAPGFTGIAGNRHALPATKKQSFSPVLLNQ
jgi:hypothetical protein